MAQDGKSTLLLADFVFMQDRAVMPEVVELEFFNRRDDLLAVVPLVKNAQSQHKHRLARINAGQ